MTATGSPDDARSATKKNAYDSPGRRPVAPAGSGFLSKAGRTFSFGSKKANVPSPTTDVPDVPQIPTIQREDESGRSRGLTNSTTSTTTPPKVEGGLMDMGGDFGTMFSGSGFDKRASMLTLKNGDQQSQQAAREKQPAALSLDHTSSVDAGPLSWNSEHSQDNLLGSRTASYGDKPPLVPRHQLSFESRPIANSPDPALDEDARLLQDTMAAARFISTVDEDQPTALPGRYRSEQDSFTVIPRKSVAATFASREDNMFAGSASKISRQANRNPVRSNGQNPQNKVMTPAEFERYRRHREQLGTAPGSQAPAPNDDDDDEINYDDDEDEIEKSKQQAKQRRKQEAHMAVYRQQMMKVTGEPAPAPALQATGRPNLPMSLSAPQLAQLKSPSPDSAGTDEDEDDEVPLAILQAHGFPHKAKPPTKLSTAGSQPNLRAASQASLRPGSSLGDSSNERQRHSTLPAFARGLPQDPFVGASVSKPLLRESLAYGGGMPAPHAPQGQAQGPLPPGGLVGVIASEERSRAMRRGSPNMEAQKFAGGANPHASGFDSMAGVPPQMMYGPGSMPGMPGMPGMSGPTPQMLTPGDQAQIQMTQQMQQFMQMQMQFMQMMASNQGGQPQMPMQPPFMGMGGNGSQVDLSGRQSVMGDFMPEPPRFNGGMRTMSMVQPNTGSFGQKPAGYAPSFHAPAPGYTPSIAPSERSNIGLPGRYRPVSQAAGSILNQHGRSNTMSGALSQYGDGKKSTINVVSKAGAGSDDDDEDGWEEMKAKREKKRSLWRTKKDFGGVLDAVT